MLSIPNVSRNVQASRPMEADDSNENQHTRLRAARERLKISASDAARSMDVTVSTYIHHENGTRTYGEADARKYARRYKVTPEYLMFGTVAPNSGKGLVREIDVRAGAGGGGFGEVVATTPSHGITVSEDAVKDVWRIPDSYLRGNLRMEASSTFIVEVSGDSGYDPSNAHAPGSILPGDRVIVNTQDRRPSPPGPFLIYDGVGLVVKLVEVLQGTEPVRLRLSSRNPSYTPYEVTEDEAYIVGRVRAKVSVM
jgi:transcriptional regulator with XRE-family HTH domain